MSAPAEPRPPRRDEASSSSGARLRVERAGLLLLGLGVGLWLLISPAAREFVGAACGCLLRLDVAGFRELLVPFGGKAWIVTSLLMVAQSLAAPIPAVPITFTNALLYGPWLGALVSWSSSQGAAALCFLLSRVLGRPFVLRLVPAGALSRFDGFFARDGGLAVLVLRLVPFISFDAVSYAAGLTSMGWLAFLVATGVGQAPATIVYSLAGASLATDVGRSGKLLLGFLGGMACAVAILVAWRRRRAASGARPGG
jgi:uncharacterized membrane protein YdjX (TVP38/TMEM64 family)